MSGNKIVLGNEGDVISAWVQTAELCHQGSLRRWKNRHAASFFYQHLISDKAQRDWFKAYLLRSEDFMFMVMLGDQAIGCIGIRLRDGIWDVYNVIRGISSIRSSGFMSLALNMIISFAQGLQSISIQCQAVAGNPAISWYLKNGFEVVCARDGRITMHYHVDRPSS